MKTTKTLFLIPLIAALSCHTPQADTVPVKDAAVPAVTVEEPAVTEVAEEPLQAEPVEQSTAPAYNTEDTELAAQIYHSKKRYYDGVWFSCGKLLTDTEMREQSLLWASAINEAHYSDDATYKIKRHIRGSKKYNKHDVRVSKQEVIGIIISESKFDPCALGPNPRKRAQELGVIKYKKRTISYSLEELEPLFTHHKFQRTKADLGPGQLYLKIGRDVTVENYKEYLSIFPGVKRVFDGLVYRGKWGNTHTPSEHWPNAKKNHWYVKKVLRLSGQVFHKKNPSSFDG